MTAKKKCVLIFPDGREAICWWNGSWELVKFEGKKQYLEKIEIKDGEVDVKYKALGYSTRPLVA